MLGVADLQAESFDAYKHLTKNMVVLMRSEEDQDVSGWKFPWSIARVNRCALPQEAHKLYPCTCIT